MRSGTLYLVDAVWYNISGVLFLVAILFPRYFWVFFQGRIIFFSSQSR